MCSIPFFKHIKTCACSPANYGHELLPWLPRRIRFNFLNDCGANSRSQLCNGKFNGRQYYCDNHPWLITKWQYRHCNTLSFSAYLASALYAPSIFNWVIVERGSLWAVCCLFACLLNWHSITRLSGYILALTQEEVLTGNYQYPYLMK